MKCNSGISDMNNPLLTDLVGKSELSYKKAPKIQ